MKRLLLAAAALAATACATAPSAPPAKLQTICMPCGNPCSFPCAPGEPKAPAAVAMPTFDPPQGYYSDAQTVKIASATPGAVIHCTTDGSEPTAASPVCAEPVRVEADTTLKAIAVAPEMTDSEVGSGVYSIAPPAPEPAAPVAEEPPPPPPPPPAPSHVTVQKERLDLDAKVQFDTGKSTIKPESNALLDDVATAMKDHPEVTHVVIEGHTDTTGAAKTNEKLARARAEAVKAYLVGKGVSAERLATKGFAGKNPVASNKTAAGREQNRRVVFSIHQ